MLHGAPDAALPASEQRPFDFKVAGKLGGLSRCGPEVIETVGKQLIGEAVTEEGCSIRGKGVASNSPLTGVGVAGVA